MYRYTKIHTITVNVWRPTTWTQKLILKMTGAPHPQWVFFDILSQCNIKEDHALSQQKKCISLVSLWWICEINIHSAVC